MSELTNKHPLMVALHSVLTEGEIADELREFRSELEQGIDDMVEGLCDAVSNQVEANGAPDIPESEQMFVRGLIVSSVIANLLNPAINYLESQDAPEEAIHGMITKILETHFRAKAKIAAVKKAAGVSKANAPGGNG